MYSKSEKFGSSTIKTPIKPKRIADHLLIPIVSFKNNFANIQAIVKIEKEKIFEINTLGNLDNPEIKVLSSDKSIDMSFTINDINQILSGNFEDVFQNLLTQ